MTLGVLEVCDGATVIDYLEKVVLQKLYQVAGITRTVPQQNLDSGSSDDSMGLFENSSASLDRLEP